MVSIDYFYMTVFLYFQLFTIDGTFLRDVSSGAAGSSKDITSSGITCIRSLGEDDSSLVAAKTKPNSVMAFM